MQGRTAFGDGKEGRTLEELAKRDHAEAAMLDGLAREARYYSESIATNMIHLGRVFTEAKKLIRHGEWSAWLRDNADCSERTAQQFMQIYARFGDNPKFARIGERSKLFKMLSLPPGSEEDFMAQNDVTSMSAREVDNAVKRYRDQLEQANNKIQELENRPAEIPEAIQEKMQAQSDLIARQQKDSERLRSDNSRLRQELDESAELLEETQQECNRAQAALLNLQSAIAKGEADQAPPDKLSVDVFASAVRQFIGSCARMPHMGRAFAAMPLSERRAYDELLSTMEGWAKEARNALNTVYEEVEVHGE